MSNSSGFRAGRGLRLFAGCFLAGLCLVLATCSRLPSGHAALSAGQQAVVKTAVQAGAQQLVATPTDDGGLRLDGDLEGHQFALAIPPRWNHQVMLFAHGYSTPGTPVDVAKNPLEKDPLDVFRTPYSEGFAVGHSAYDKAGIGVESAVINTYRLKKFTDALGATRTYLIGASMGGDIVMASIEKYPHAYAGAIAACGAVAGWPQEVGWLIDIRAAYNYFTKGTSYELPGNKDLTKSAFTTADGSGLLGSLPLLVQIHKIADPVFKLFRAAKANPGGPEDRMIDNIVAAAHTEKDVAAVAYPLATVTLGQDDMMAVFGGMIYGNTNKVYSSPHLTPAQNAALNRGIQRVKADPAAIAKADAWYKPDGHFDAKLLSLYNSVDSLAPTNIHEVFLRQVVERAGNSANLLQRPVPPVETPDFFGSGLPGLAHCGFTPKQVKSAFDDLHAWVETGKKPAP
jgi:pimeloyl-ACP methyl ester carboxylesterase